MGMLSTKLDYRPGMIRTFLTIVNEIQVKCIEEAVEWMNLSEMQSFYNEFPNYQDEEEVKGPSVDKEFIRSLVNSSMLNRLKDTAKEYLIYLDSLVEKDFTKVTAEFVDQ